MAYAEKRGKGDMPWRVRFRRPDGTYESVSGFRTKSDALAHGRAQETDVERGEWFDPRAGDLTVTEYADRWLESIDVGPLTLRDYRSRVRAHIVPRWGADEVGSVTATAVNAWAKQLRDRDGLGETRIRDILTVLRTMMDDAIADGLRKDNPVARSTRRGRYVSKRKREEDRRAWATDEQAAAIAENAREQRGLMGYAIVLTLAYTGMRIAELAALRRDECHLLGKDHEQWLDVQQQMQYVDGTYQRVDCKYGSARRLVIPPGLKDLLAQVLASHDKEHVFCAPKGGRLVVSGGEFYESSWRVWVHGRDARPSSRGHKARPAIAAVPGIGDVDPHGLRHGHKVWLDEDGHSPVAIETRMGHELRGVEGVYSHVSPEMERRISERLQARWERTVAGQGAGLRQVV